MCAGYVDTKVAHEAGFSNQMLRYYVKVGRLERAGVLFGLARQSIEQGEGLSSPLEC